MPYQRNTDLPKSVRESLPQGAQTIYRKAFNSACDQYEKPQNRRDSSSQEETAHRVAWAAVKNSYKKKKDYWVKKD